MSQFLKALGKKVLVANGATGTQLQKYGFRGPFDLWNIVHSEEVRHVYWTYFFAGANIVKTNTFGANRLALEKYNLQNFFDDINRGGVRLAHQVCPEGCFVAGCIGPTGVLFEPHGKLTPSSAYETFAEQAQLLAQAGADVIFVETMSDPAELDAAVRAAKKTGLPVVASMAFKCCQGKIGFKTEWGTDIPSAIRAMEEAGADVVGANCGVGFGDMIYIMQEMIPLAKRPLIAQPNAGLPEIVEGKAVYRQYPEYIQNWIKDLVSSGANIVGGCCGTEPDHTRLMRQFSDEKKS